MAVARRRDPHSGYKNCEKCGASFDDLYIGGAGVWRNRILCLKCQNFQTAPFRIIAELVHEQYSSVTSVEHAKEILDAEQRDYELEVAEQSDFSGGTS